MFLDDKVLDERGELQIDTSINLDLMATQDINVGDVTEEIKTSPTFKPRSFYG
jgi:hypothetical protein